MTRVGRLRTVGAEAAGGAMDWPNLDGANGNKPEVPPSPTQLQGTASVSFRVPRRPRFSLTCNRNRSDTRRCLRTTRRDSRDVRGGGRMRSFVSGLARESTVRGDSTCLSEPNVQTLYWLVAQDASDAVQSAVASGTGSDSLLQ